MEQVTPHVYVETQYESGNVGFILTDAGAVCVDVPMLPSNVRDWRLQIASVTNKPVIALIQTDYDQVRVVGTYLFKVPLIAHDNAWDRIKIYSSEKMLNQINELIEKDGYRGRRSRKSKWQARPPDITFSERLILYKGGSEIHVIYGGGHSSATCMVHLPEENVLFSGDLIHNGQHPSMTYAQTKQWLSALGHLRNMPTEIIVPGHGAICTKSATLPLSEYIRDMRAMVKKSFQAGRSKSETSSAVIPKFFDRFPYTESQRDQVRARIKGGSDRIYDEYRAQAKARAASAKGTRKSTARRSRSRKSSRRARKSS